MKLGRMVGMVCVVMLACDGGLREAENQLSIVNERLAPYKAAATATAKMPTRSETDRYECNMKIATALWLIAINAAEREFEEELRRGRKTGKYRGMGEQIAESRRDFVEERNDPILTEWAESSGPLIRRYNQGVGFFGEAVFDIKAVVHDLRSGEC